MSWPMRSDPATHKARPSPSEVLEAYATKTPPVNLQQLANDLGLSYEVVALPLGISGKLERDASAQAGFRVVVNAYEPARRQRFTTAHEVAHYILHRDLIGEGGVTDDAMYHSALLDEYERQADRLAAQILLPAQAVRAAYRAVKTVSGLADMFNASNDAIRIRLKELRLSENNVDLQRRGRDLQAAASEDMFGVPTYVIELGEEVVPIGKIRKDVGQRTEEVRYTVRNTEVDVEHTDAAGVAGNKPKTI